MANRAYLRVWTRDFNEQTMIVQFARFLATAPVTESGPGFQRLIVQPIDGTETPIAEWDLKTGRFGPAEVAALIAGNAAVYAVVEDIADRGLASDELVGGVKQIRKAELPQLFDRFDGVWQW
jgi:hypothetical protein